MKTLTKELAKKLIDEHVRSPHLLEHAVAVSAAMEAMARHFGEDEAYWAAVGYAHDVDYEEYPDTHLQHTRPILEAAGVEEETIRAILAHGWGSCEGAVEPQTPLENSLYTVDSLTGLVSAAAKMRGRRMPRTMTAPSPPLPNRMDRISPGVTWTLPALTFQTISSSRATRSPPKPIQRRVRFSISSRLP